MNFTEPNIFGFLWFSKGRWFVQRSQTVHVWSGLGQCSSLFGQSIVEVLIFTQFLSEVSRTVRRKGPNGPHTSDFFQKVLLSRIIYAIPDN